jgi:hypothetical protein
MATTHDVSVTTENQTSGNRPPSISQLDDNKYHQIGANAHETAPSIMANLSRPLGAVCG